jgi:hypothetical protein
LDLDQLQNPGLTEILAAFLANEFRKIHLNQLKIILIPNSARKTIAVLQLFRSSEPKEHFLVKRAVVVNQGSVGSEAFHFVFRGLGNVLRIGKLEYFHELNLI